MSEADRDGGRPAATSPRGSLGARGRTGGTGRTGRMGGAASWRALVATLVVASVTIAFATLASRGPGGWGAVFGAARAGGELAAILTHRGAVGWIGPTVMGDLDGTSVRRLGARDPLVRALTSADPSVPARAMDARGMRVLVLETSAARGARPGSVLATLGRFGTVDGFRTLYLRAGLVVMERFELPRMRDVERQALARAARLILDGAVPPRLAQFPTSLRAPFATEVLVMVRRPVGDLALWRSARSSSLASGTLTASGVARQRWAAREGTLGGNLDDALPRLAVEVAVLVDDGTFGTRDASFLDRAIGPEHGVAYDEPSTWRYLLPESTERRTARTGSAAFRALFRDNQLRGDGFARSDLRLYRVRVVPIAISSPAAVDD